MKRLLGNLAVLATSTLFFLLLVEIGLRISGYDPTFAVPDRTIGSRWRPHAHYRWTREGHSEGRINAAGWPDRDYTESKPPHTTRILVCGDSYVAALEVPLDSTFHKRLERQLNARAAPGERFEVIAMGRAGGGTTEEYLTYRTWGVRYQPDVVVVMFVLNDWADNLSTMWGEPERPFFVEDGDSLRLDTSFLDTPHFHSRMRLTKYKEWSSLVTLAALVRQNLRARYQPKPAEAGLTGERGWYQSWNFLASPRADSIPAFHLTARILDRFARQVRQDGRRFVVFVVGASEQEDRDLLARNRRIPGFDADKPQRYLAAVGARDGFETVALTPAFREASARGGGPLWNGSPGKYAHWNSAGHAVAAEVMARYLSATLPGIGPLESEAAADSAHRSPAGGTPAKQRAIAESLTGSVASPRR